MDKLNFNGSQIINQDYPGTGLVTIITVVLNRKEDLERTIQSIISQTYKNIEYIIIDGGSTDGTLDVIKKYQHIIYAWISETDKGIYEAMNKGIGLANGEFINFMNAGDLFCDAGTIEKIFKSYPFRADIIYGDSEFVYNDGSVRIKKAGSPKDLWKGMNFSHQSLFTRSALLKNNKFNNNLTIGADFDFIFNMYSKGLEFYYLGLVISRITAGGSSDRYPLQSVLDWWRVIRKQRNNLKVRVYYSVLFLKESIVLVIKKIIPRRIINLPVKFKGKFLRKS